MILKDVKSNKRKTAFIITLFFCFVGIFIYFLSLWLSDSIYVSVFMGLTAATISSFASYYNSDKMILKLNGAREATREENLQMNLILEGLCLAANLPKPKLYIMEDSAMNAFATGRNPEHAVICVTTGLMSRLDKYELEGVLAHELSHIRNYDILLSSITIAMVGLVVILSDAFSRMTFHSDDNDKKNPIIMVISVIFILLAPIFAQLIKLAISRNREYLADASAVELTRNKEGLIHALQKLTDDSEALEQANKSSASLFIVNPLVNERKRRTSVWSTHPDTMDRIERLQRIS